MNKIIVNFCPTGIVPIKSMTPYVPVSPQEIIEQTHQAFELGITIAHLHARNDDETPTHRADIYYKIFEGVRKFCPGLIVCFSTSGRNWSEFEKRSEVIEVKPDLCSLTLSSLNFLNQTSVNSPEIIIKLALKMKDYGVTPEMECFDLGMINYGKYLINKGIIEGPFYWNLLFGNITGYQAKTNHIGAALNEIPDKHHVALAGLGEHQLPVNALAIAMGYGVRVGIEDNVWWDVSQKKLASNIQLLERIHKLISLHGAELMTSEELGRMGFYNRKK